MASEAETQTCFHHKDRETGRSCTRCGRPACPDCLHPAAVGSHCFECIRAARPPAKERLRRWNATAGPLVSQVLLALNVGVYLLMLVSKRVQPELVLFGPAVEAGEYYRLVTSGFVHFGLIHLGFNMALLYRLGDMLEPVLGRVKFAVLYFVALLAGSGLALVLTPDAFTGGASGAVFGLMGAVVVGNRLGGLNVRDAGIGALLAINLVLTFGIPGISIGGHLGGLAGGMAVGALLLRRR